MLHENDRKKLRIDEEEEEEESDETGEGKTEDLDPNEDEKERIRRAVKKGKEPMSKLGMSKEGRQLDIDYYDYDYDYNQSLAILRTIWDYKSKTGDFPYPPTIKLLDFIMYSIPNLNISREKLAKKITTFKNNYDDAWELDGDNPGLDRPVDREIFNLSMRLWGDKKGFYEDWKWK